MGDHLIRKAAQVAVVILERFAERVRFLLLRHFCQLSTIEVAQIAPGT